MEKKFLDQGLDRSEIEAWIEELSLGGDEERVFYDDIEPILEFIRERSAINPSIILNQWVARYESGELLTVPQKTYQSALKLRKRITQALRSDSKFEIEKLREEIYGKREGLTLFCEVESELEFLKKFGGMSTRKYLSRSITHYRKSKLKRIATWRAEKIKGDCHRLLQKIPVIKLRDVPRSYLHMRLEELLAVLRLGLKKRVMEDESGTLERFLLAPARNTKGDFETEKYGITSMDKAALALGISKQAFDLLVARHSDVFRKIATYHKKWYLPNLYLKDLSKSDRFALVKAKYEFLAKGLESRQN